MSSAVFALMVATQAAWSETPEDVLAKARADCAEFDSGEMSVDGDPFAKVDLTGDGVDDTIVDTASFQCSTLASFGAGTGGSMVHVFAGDQVLERLALSWQIVEAAGSKVLLFYLHGSECGSFGAEPCFEAVVWGGSSFLTVRGVQQPE
jgi:hypothetical protein